MEWNCTCLAATAAAHTLVFTPSHSTSSLTRFAERCVMFIITLARCSLLSVLCGCVHLRVLVFVRMCLPFLPV